MESDGYFPELTMHDVGFAWAEQHESKHGFFTGQVRRVPLLGESRNGCTYHVRGWLYVGDMDVAEFMQWIAG